jgi:hypothetical protein
MDCRTVEGELLAFLTACHSPFLVQFHESVKDFIENASVEDSDRENVANKV